MHFVDMGDYIGAESCFDLMADTENNMSEWIRRGGGGGEKKEERRMKNVAAGKSPPPLITLSQMPWEMERYSTEDGRLIVKATRRREFFETRRSDGRVCLDIVRVDDATSEESDGDDDTNGSEADNGGEKINDGGDGLAVVAAVADRRVSDGGGNKCSDSLNVGVAMSEIRPVLHA